MLVAMIVYLGFSLLSLASAIDVCNIDGVAIMNVGVWGGMVIAAGVLLLAGWLVGEGGG